VEVGGWVGCNALQCLGMTEGVHPIFPGSGGILLSSAVKLTPDTLLASCVQGAACERERAVSSGPSQETTTTAL